MKWPAGRDLHSKMTVQEVSSQEDNVIWDRWAMEAGASAVRNSPDIAGQQDLFNCNQRHCPHTLRVSSPGMPPSLCLIYSPLFRNVSQQHLAEVNVFACGDSAPFGGTTHFWNSRSVLEICGLQLYLLEWINLACRLWCLKSSDSWNHWIVIMNY